NIDANNNNAAGTTVSSLTTGAGTITFDQSGGGAVSYTTATTTNGSIVLTSDNANLTVGTNVNEVGRASGRERVSTTAGNVTLKGTTTAADQVTVNSVGSVNGAGLVTALVVDLNAVKGIGNTTPLNLAPTTITADTTNGNIDANNNNAAGTTVSSLTTGAGTITFDPSGGGAVSYTTAPTPNGSIVLTSDNANLTVGTNVNAGGAGSDVTLTTTTAGNVILTGTTTAADQVTVNSVGSVNGVRLVLAIVVDLNAVTGIGNTTPLNLAATTLTADTTNGNIDANNNNAAGTTVSSRTTGAGTLPSVPTRRASELYTTATTTNGSIVLTSDNANLTV